MYAYIVCVQMYMYLEVGIFDGFHLQCFVQIGLILIESESGSGWAVLCRDAKHGLCEGSGLVGKLGVEGGQGERLGEGGTAVSSVCLSGNLSDF